MPAALARDLPQKSSILSDRRWSGQRYGNRLPPWPATSLATNNVMLNHFNASPRSEPEAARGSPARTKGTLWPSTRSLKYKYLIGFATLHTLALFAASPWLFSWVGVVMMFITGHISGMWGIVIGYHRLLCHKSFCVPKWVERTLATCALCTLQETPARWVAWHRAHHCHSDRHADPHSPREGIFWAHLLWLVRGTHEEDRERFSTTFYAPDILRDPYYRWIESLPMPSLLFYIAHTVAVIALMATAFVGLYGPTTEAVRMTLSALVWGVFVRTVIVWHITWSVNSLAHVFGYRNFDTPDASRNNWLVALLASGEGWHNNHHADPSSATVRVRWWEFDLAYSAISLLAFLGIASDVVLPRHLRRAEQINRPESLQERTTGA